MVLYLESCLKYRPVVQLRLASPVALSLVMGNCLNLVSLSFAGRFGTEVRFAADCEIVHICTPDRKVHAQDLASAALGMTVGNSTGRLLMLGLCGALDTFASQAVGAGELLMLRS